MTPPAIKCRHREKDVEQGIVAIVKSHSASIPVDVYTVSLDEFSIHAETRMRRSKMT